MGDTHANVTWWSTVVRTAIRVVRPDAVVSVGDFGYWPDHEEGRLFLREVADSATTEGTGVWFVDGNHEQHDRLVPASTPTAVHPSIHHLPRGARWSWQSIRFGALGGAVSPDREDRSEGWDWFASEAICDADLARLGRERLDVLVTHDAPTWCRLGGMPVSADIGRDAERNRAFIDRAIESTRPTLVLHGHWHIAHRTTGDPLTGRPTVFGLGADGAPPDSTLALLRIERACGTLTWVIDNLNHADPNNTLPRGDRP